MTDTMEVCELCGVEGEGATAWGGWCHDCDASMEGVNDNE